MICGFTARNWKLKAAFMPTEESLSIDTENGIFSVADGVTRDPCEYLPDTDTLWGKLKFAARYPRPSPAKHAADIFTKYSCEHLLEYDKNNRNEESIQNAFVAANKEISRYKKRKMKSIDYLVNDHPGCVAALASVQDHVVTYGYIADAGLAFFDCFGTPLSKTEDDGPSKYHENIWKDAALRGLTWRDPAAREFIRRTYRNNPDQLNSFGVLTGEDSANYYVRTGRFELSPDGFAPPTNLVLYTDGLAHAIYSPQFVPLLKCNAVNIPTMERFCNKKVKSEGTLIYACVN
ncbi:MAG: hypothetical protein RL557_580 [archaeon]|jgi:hypothetical protein